MSYPCLATEASSSPNSCVKISRPAPRLRALLVLVTGLVVLPAVGGAQFFDFGDAPDPTYPTLTANGGASHIIGSTLYMGQCVDAEKEGQPSATADGDDLAVGSPVRGTCVGDSDEDGVVFTSILSAGSMATVDVEVTEGCILSAWIDFDGDGDWQDPGEDIFPGGQALVGGVNGLIFPVPASATPGSTFSRFRCTSDGVVSFDGQASDGEVEDYTVMISGDVMDFGDAPDPSFPTVGAGAASHTLGSGLFLGSCVDSEAAGQPSADADGDDIAPGSTVDGTCSTDDDEDGVVFTSILVGGSMAQVEVVASAACTLSAWIDFNGDGDWDEASDELFVGGQALSAGVNALSFSVPAGATSGLSYGRFRCTTDGAVSFDGAASDGEVEDHAVVIGAALDFGDAQDPTFATLLANDGARHTLGGSVYLGSCVDAEADAAISADHSGDDVSEGQPVFGTCGSVGDEDGVVFTSALVAGEMADIEVTANSACNLSAWIDFENNGDWTGTGEEIFTGMALSSGVNALSFAVPADATFGDVAARFRCTTDGAVPFTGLASDGEVEDYLVSLSALDFGDAPEPDFPTRVSSNGARHVIDPTSRVILGSCIDGEADGLQSANATGDDVGIGFTTVGSCVGNDDEDGVAFPGSLIIGGSGSVDVTVLDACTLSAWIDFNGDGDWDEASDELFPGGQPLQLGTTTLNFSVPATAVAGSTFARFRCTTDGPVSFDGLASDGEVEDYRVTIQNVMDFGDASGFFPVVSAVNGARHALGSGLYLGNCVDGEADGLSSPMADGDDLAVGGSISGTCVNGDDEDGVAFTSTLLAGAMASVDVVASAACSLSAWIDFNGNGFWFENNERIFNGQALAAGVNSLTFAVPGSATTGPVFARFRCTTDGAVNFTGAASDGEVEDYQVVLGAPLDFGDAADPSFPSLLANDGARHSLGSNVFLGSCVDAESDSVSTSGADGDDLISSSLAFGTCVGNDDEDGVAFGSARAIAGSMTNLTVTANAACTLSGWVDFNLDGDWNDSGEDIFPGGTALSAGVNMLSFAAPSTTATGIATARFRCTTDGAVSFTGAASDGEVEDYTIEVSGVDFGDAPDPTYPTLLASNGASHVSALGNFAFLGTCVDIEVDGQGSSSAEGDDLAVGGTTLGTCSGDDDEDGVAFTTAIAAGSDAELTVVARGPCTLSAWIDYNGDGDWDEASDELFPGGTPLVTGPNNLTVAVPAAAVSGETFARFRCTTDGPVSFTGQASDGEVEDYQVTIGAVLDFGDAPDPTYPTLLANDGARHDLGGTLFLGQCADGDADGQPSGGADGDDLNVGAVQFGGCGGGNDEDGVTFTSPLVAGLEATVTVMSSEACTLSAWIDFNGDGSWAEAGDDLFVGGEMLAAGSNFLTFDVPSTAASDTTTFARFRCTTDGVVGFTGSASDGEVEDYQVDLVALDFGDAPDPTFPTTLAADGARHGLGTNVFLGTCADSETDGQPTASADGDDLSVGANEQGLCETPGDDDDGVVFNTSLINGELAEIEVVAASACTLSAWIDFNGDGDWDEPTDGLFFGGTVLAAGSSTLTFTVPEDATPGVSFARFRCTTDGPVSFDGAAADGEVEDYRVSIADSADYGDAPDPTYPTLLASNGARHLGGGGIFLGACVDQEGDGQPNALASGDDDGVGVGQEGTCVGDDDEDGVTFNGPLAAGSTATISVQASAACTLSGWIDFDRDGSWDDAGEDLFPGGTVLAAGVNNLMISVPGTAVTGPSYARFRCTTDGAVGFTGEASDGEVEDYGIGIGVSLDFGDAAEPGIPTLLANSGPSHILGSNVYLGSCVDAEIDGQPSAIATGDDFNASSPVFGTCASGSDEDGVVFTSAVTAGAMVTVDVTANAACTLSAWVDFNNDGDFGEANEDVFPGGTALAAGVNNLSFTAPGSSAASGDLMTRFRCTTDGAVSFTGQASDGEVEDHIVPAGFAVDLGDAPEPPYATTTAGGGPRHILGGGIYLGSCVDAESTGFTNADATADDDVATGPVFGTCTGGDDEDGVTFLDPLVEGMTANYEVVASIPCTLFAWIDFNGNGSFLDAGESLFPTGTLLASGTNSFMLTVPSGELADTVFARFRCSSSSTLTPTSFAFDGEVEDYSLPVTRAQADLVVTQVDAPDPAVAGGANVVYTVTVANTGVIDAEDVVVNEMVPAGATLVSTSGCAEDPMAVPTCTLGTIAAGGSAMYTITVSLPADASGTLTHLINATSSTDLANLFDDTSSETTAIVAVADLVISKSDSPDPVVAGTGLVYTVTVTNNGPSNATDVVVTETLPAGVTLVSTSGCVEDPAAIPTCSLGDLVVGASAMYTISVDVDSSTLGTITNMASASSSAMEGNPGDETVSEDTIVTATADLVISKVDSVDPAVAGTALAYTVTVDNNGPSDATDVVVTETLPAGVTFVSTSGCSEDPTGVPTCTLGTVAAGGSAQYTVNVTVDSDTLGTITNGVSVASSATEGNPGDESASEDTEIEQEASLRLSKGDSVDPVLAGETLTYTLQVDNDGPSDASDVTVFDVLPEGAAYLSDTGGCTQPSDLSGWRASLSGDAEVPPVATSATGLASFVLDTATLELHFAIHVGTIDNIVAAHIHSGAAGTNGPVVQFLYSGSPVFDPTMPITGSIQLTAAEAMALVDDPHYVNVHTSDFPAGEIRGQITPATQTPLSCSLGTIAGGGDSSFQVLVDVDDDAADGSTLTNVGIAMSSTTDPDAVALPSPNGMGVLRGATAQEDTTVDTEADLSVLKVDSVDPVTAGTALTYTITVANAGPSDAQNVVATETLPAGVTFVSTTGCSEDPGGVPTCSLGTIAAGSSAQYTVTVDVAASTAGTLSNSVSVASSTTDPTAANNTAVEETMVIGMADLSITKTDDVDPVVAGENLTYTVTVSNAGPSDAQGVMVTETLPSAVTFVSTSGCAADPNGVPICDLGVIAAGGSAQYTVTVTVDPSATGTLTNSVSVSASTGDPVAGNNSATEDTAVIAEADLSITKVDDVDPVIAGETLVYTLTVDNAGPSDAQEVVVTDTLPAGVTLVSTAGCSEDPSAVPTCTLGTIAAGSSAQYTVTVTVDASTVGTLTNSASVASSTTDDNPANDSTSEDTAVETSADLSISKVDDVDPVIAGTNLVYTVTVSNAGPSDALDVAVTETLPAAVTLVSTVGCTEDPSGVPTCNLGTVAAGSTAQFTVEVTVDPSTLGTITNAVSVASTTDDPDAMNNDTTEDTEVEGSADLSITKADSLDPAAAGQTLTYTIEVTNNGPSDALGVEVTETLPADVTFVATSGCQGDPNGVPVCELGDLPAGDMVSYTVEVTIDGGAMGSLTNSVTVAADTADPDSDNNSADEETSLDEDPPTVTLVNTVDDTGDGELSECEEVRVGISEILLTFSEALRDPAGDTDADDVTNPDNYLLVAAGSDRDFSTEVCGGPLGDDVAVGIQSVTYDVGTLTATLDVGGPLGDSLYRLLACGSTTLRDLAGNALDGDGDGVRGDDFVRTYRVERNNLFTNGHFDCSIDTWVAVSTVPEEIAYSDEDFDDSSVSGSAGITNLSASSDFSLGQCAPVVADRECLLSSRVRLAAAAGVDITVTQICEYFSQPSCVDSLELNANVTLLQDTAGEWLQLQYPSTSPANAVSALCSLDLRTADGDDFDAFLDEAFLNCTPTLFSDGFESGDTSGWSNAIP